MELLNELQSFRANEPSRPVLKEALDALVLLLSPFAPYLSEELWSRLGNESSLFDHAWPAYDPDVAAEDILTIVLQVNGKVRSRIDLPASIGEEEIRNRALENERIQHWIGEKEVRRVIVVPGKLVNVVV